MSTVILKWNPSFSSYSILRYLQDLYYTNKEGVDDFNRSVWYHDKIREGDRFFFVKLGYGAQGITASGTITSDPYLGDDWTGAER